MKRKSAARWVLIFCLIGLVGVGLLGTQAASAAGPADSAVAGAEPFQQLDADAEQILNEVTLLGAEMAVLEEARAKPAKTQLLVLVSVDPSSFFQLDAIQLQIDGHVATLHQYTEKELNALQQGGSHRLFWENIPAGRHQLTVSMMGRVPKDPDFQREASLMIVSGVGPRVVDLHVASGKSQPFPELSLQEWK